MKYTQKQLAVMTNQNLNIALQNKLGIGWVIKHENNEEERVYKFSDYVLGDFSKTELPNFCAGCKELCGLMVEHKLGVTTDRFNDKVWCVTQGVSAVNSSNTNPWRAVVEYLLLEVEL